MRWLLHYVQSQLNLGNIWKSRCDWLFYWIVAIRYIIFLCCEIFGGRGWEQPFSRRSRVKEEAKREKRGWRWLDWTFFFFFVTLYEYFVGPSLRWAINCLAGSMVPAPVLHSLRNVAHLSLLQLIFAPKTLHSCAGHDHTAAMSLSSWWQVNIHFHPNTCPTSSIFDSWEVSLQGIDVAVHF